MQRERKRQARSAANSVLLLDASLSQPQCCQDTVFGTLVLTGHSNQKIGTQTIAAASNDSTNSLAPVVSSLSVFCCRSDRSFVIQPLFPVTTSITSSSISSPGGEHKANKKTDLQDLTQTTRSIRGLQRRLEQMVQSEVAEIERRSLVSTARSLDKERQSHPLGLFLRQSDMIFREFVIAVRYYRKGQQKHQGGATDREGGAQRLNSNLDFAKALFEALEDLERYYSGHKDIVENLDDDLERITLQYKDDADRSHMISMQLSLGADQESVIVLSCEASLPPAAFHDFPASISQSFSNEDEAAEPDANNLKTTQDMPSPLDELFESSDDYTPENGKPPPPTIQSCFQEFISRVQSLQNFFNEMEHMDGRCTVLDLESDSAKRRRETHRTIKVTNSVRMLLNVNAYRPHESPTSYRFTFSSRDHFADEAATFSSRFETNVAAGLWNSNAAIAENLERCLGISLSSPGLKADESKIEADTGDYVDSELGESQVEDEGNECGICYNRELPVDDDDDDNDEEDGNGITNSGQPPELPSIICEHKSCGREYHQSCLQEWLESLSSSRVTFDIIIGQCPYCQQPISAPLPGS